MYPHQRDVPHWFSAWGQDGKRDRCADCLRDTTHHLGHWRPAPSRPIPAGPARCHIRLSTPEAGCHAAHDPRCCPRARLAVRPEKLASHYSPARGDNWHRGREPTFRPRRINHEQTDSAFARSGWRLLLLPGQQPNRLERQRFRQCCSLCLSWVMFSSLSPCP
jgi:hypothetical protein